MTVMAMAALPDVSDANFAETSKRAVRQAVVPLPGYQHEAMKAKGRVEVYKWCRQSGKDFTAALKASLQALSTGQPWFIVSLTERQALATFDKVKMHLRAFGVVLTDLQFVDEELGYQDRNTGQWCKVNAKKVVLPGGGSVTALPGSNPDAIAGLTGNVIFTEFALFPGGGKDHWRVVFPLITRGFRIIAISTPRGHDTKFAELCRDQKGKYWVSVVDVHRMVGDGVKLRDEEGNSITVAELEELYADPAGWTREYLVQESDELDALIRWHYLELAKADYEAVRLDVSSIDDYNPDHENVFAELPRGGGAYFLGWDVARKGHLSSLWLNQVVGDVHYLRVLVNMHKMDFPYMRKVVWQAMDMSCRGAGDATGLGMESCEATAKRYPGWFDEVNFSSAKPALGSKMMQVYEDVRQRIPAKGFDDVIHDLHAVQKEVRLGRLILHETKNAVNKNSHCDMAYANGLALWAATDAARGPREAVFGRRLRSNSVGRRYERV